MLYDIFFNKQNTPKIMKIDFINNSIFKIILIIEIFLEDQFLIEA